MEAQSILNIFATPSDDEEDCSIISRHEWSCRDLTIVYHLALIAPGHGDSLWNAGCCVAELLGLDRSGLLPQTFEWPPRSSFEFGAGAALPSMALLREGTEHLYISDQKSNEETFQALKRSIDENSQRWGMSIDRVCVLAHNWGEDLDQLAGGGCSNMDILVACDCIYNPDYHESLLRSAAQLIHNIRGVFVVAFSFHTNVQAEKVLRFFELATSAPFDFLIVREFQKDYVSQLGIGATDAKRGSVHVRVLASKDSIFA